MDKNKVLIGIVIAGMVGNIILLYWLLFDFKSDIETKFRQIELRLASDIPNSNSSDQLPVPTIPSPPSGVSSCSADCNDEIDALTARVEKLESTPTAQTVTSATTQSSSGVREVFVPLGNGTIQSREWIDVPGANAYIDSGNYGTIKSAQFEVSLRIPTANGTLSARLYNKTDDHPVWFSEVSTESDKSVLKQSEKITLDSGNKLYQVQAKNTMNAVSIVESARIKLILQ